MRLAWATVTVTVTVSHGARPMVTQAGTTVTLDRDSGSITDWHATDRRAVSSVRVRHGASATVMLSTVSVRDI
jgi:hypothetical protein